MRGRSSVGWLEFIGNGQHWIVLGDGGRGGVSQQARDEVGRKNVAISVEGRQGLVALLSVKQRKEFEPYLWVTLERSGTEGKGIMVALGQRWRIALSMPMEGTHPKQACFR